MDIADKKAAEAGFRRWEDVPKATQSDILRKDAELSEALEAKDAYYERFPGRQSQEDFVFTEIDNSRRFTEDTLLASWKAVEAGNLSLVDFRQRFSDATANHAFLTARLMDGLDPTLKQRDGETEQDYYGRLYHGIQPEQYDVDQDGIVSPVEWDAWRESRKQFWNAFPAARKFRTYVEVDYPTRHWRSDDMAALHRKRTTLMAAYDAFLQIPKYRGMSAEDGNFLDSVLGLADRKAREIQFMLAEKGLDPRKVRIPAKLAWRMVLEDLQGQSLTDRQIDLIKIAILLDRKPAMKKKLLGAERAQYLMDNREMTAWYPSAFQDAGLDDRMIALLGLADAPLGTSVLERVTAATAA
jgi:hypothetical protein